MSRAKRLKTKGIYFLYRVLQAFGLPALLLYFLYRSLWNRGYWRSLPERFGFVPRTYRQTGPGAIWLHTVSVGEVLSCIELVRRLRSAFPHTRVFVSTATVAGHATAVQKLQGRVDAILYAPVDYVWAVRRVLRAVRPSIVVIAETEIWPNLIRETKRTGAAVAIVNGRISDRAFPRYCRWKWFFRAVLPQVDVVLAQSEEIRRRFVELGAQAERVVVAGNFKYDFAPPELRDAELRDFLARGRVWIAASTMTDGAIDEDDGVIAAWRELAARYPELILVHAPRKPERFEVAAKKWNAAGFPFAQRTRFEAREPTARVLLLDTIGELAGLFSMAEVVFMGGTLADRGGHNILEPSLFGKPVIVGPHLENFQAIADEFRSAEACIGIGTMGELAGAVARVLDDPEYGRAMGERARACAEARRGATARAVDELRELYCRDVPRYRPAAIWHAIGWVLTHAWRRGGIRKRAADLQAQKRIDLPVISIGNLTMGGTGKTPCVLRVAELLRADGRRPGILTRGYKRNTPHAHLLLAPGAAVPTVQSGDEPQIFIRSGVAPVGVGADRWRTGMQLRRQFDVDVMVLDDGFQHLRLARDLDIVLVDALNPFGGGYLFPLGRLREPPAGLDRADVIVITRASSSDLACAIERVLRRFNSHAPVFRASVRPREWVENRTGRTLCPDRPPFGRPGVFCGLGNPQAFRRTLEQMGIEPVEWVDFEDHHHYRPQELRRIAHLMAAHGASSLVTTEKDAVNLCDDCDTLLAPLPLYWLRIGMEIEREREFLGEIERRVFHGR